MEELVIQTHNFETSKNQLKKFSEQTTTDLSLKKVDTAKGVGEWLGDWIKGAGIGTDHKVTGEELNGLTTQIQTHLIDINHRHKTFIQEFGQVYNALEALDKDYIQAILIAIQSAQKANEEVTIAQGDIEKTIDVQKKTLKVLEHFKEKIDRYNHLIDIDTMYDDTQLLKDEVNMLKETITKQDNLIVNLQKKVHNVQHKPKDEEGKLLNKIKTLYLLVGGAFVFIIIELFLLMRVI